MGPFFVQHILLFDFFCVPNIFTVFSLILNASQFSGFTVTSSSSGIFTAFERYNNSNIIIC